MNAPPEPVSSRTIPRYRGKAIRHRLRYACHDSDIRWPRGYFTCACAARACDFTGTLDGGYTAAHLAKLNRQHAGKP